MLRDLYGQFGCTPICDKESVCVYAYRIPLHKYGKYTQNAIWCVMETEQNPSGDSFNLVLPDAIALNCGIILNIFPTQNRFHWMFKDLHVPLSRFPSIFYVYFAFDTNMFATFLAFQLIYPKVVFESGQPFYWYFIVSSRQKWQFQYIIWKMSTNAGICIGHDYRHIFFFQTIISK